MKNLKITTVQFSPYWHEKEKNLSRLDEMLDETKEPTDLIILPEMFATGFTMAADAHSEKADGPVIQWLEEKAREKNAVVTGSIIIEEDKKYYNRLIWMRPDGSFAQYDKRHLFRMATENEYYTAGHEQVTVELNGWKIMPLICYDLRFPVWSRNYEKMYDMAIYIANWPERRADAWKQLLFARAIENQAYIIGVNRIGVDGNSVIYSGDSMVISPKGERISQTKAYQEITETMELSHKALQDFRKDFPVWKDSDRFQLGI